MNESAEAERHVLACSLLDGGDTLSRCTENGIETESFFDPRHQIIFGLLLALQGRHLPITIEVLGSELKTSGHLDGAGGWPYLLEVTGQIPTTVHAGYFIEKVREFSILRRLATKTAEVSEQCRNFTGSLPEFIDRAEQDIFRITQARVSAHAKSAPEIVKEGNTILAKLLLKRGELTGVASGFKDLDALTFGFQKQEMIVLAARPSMGKTSLALNIAETASLPKTNRDGAGFVLIFSMEMSSSQLSLRLLCSRARVNIKLIREGLVSRDGREVNELGRAAEELKKSALLIDDSSSLTIMEIRAKARRIHSRHRLGLVIVDYLQLVAGTDPKMPREQQVAEVSRGLKALARELDVPVIVLSQLNRASEKENRAPRLSDLRESGAIEQDADVVLILSRPRDVDEKFQTTTGSADLVVAKQRNGPVGEVRLTFLQDITRFENWTA